MSDESTTLTSLPESILDEIEKVSKMEKDLVNLQKKHGVVEKNLDTIQKVLSIDEVDDDVIDDTDNSKKISKKTERNLTKKDKIKTNLESFEKKRYENIGVEFAKGAEKVFDELKKAQLLKSRMSTTNLDKLEKNQEKEEKSNLGEKKKKFSFLKLGLAITAVAGILYLFRDKVSQIIPGFKEGYEKFVNPLKNIGKAIFGDLIDNIVTIFDSAFGSIFQGSDGVKSTINKFFLQSLPNVMYQSGIALFSAFGGEVSTNLKTMSNNQIQQSDAALQAGQEEAEKLKRIKQEASQNAAIRNDVFATTGQIEKAQRQLGRDIIVNAQLDDVVSRLYSVEKKKVWDFSSYANSFLNFVDKNREDVGTELSEEESLKLASLFWEQNGKKTRNEDGSLSEEFTKWHSTTWKMNVNSDNWASLVKAAESFRQNVKNESILQKDKERLEEIQKATLNEFKGSAIKYGGKDNKKIELKVEPAKIAEDVYAASVQSLFETFKNLFSGKNTITIDAMTNSVIKFINDAIDRLINPLIKSMDSFCNLFTASTTYQTVQINQNQNDNAIPQQQISHHDTSNPIILLDLKLDGNLLASIDKMFKHEESLLKEMRETNEKLKSIKALTIAGKKASTGNEKPEAISNDDTIKQLSIISKNLALCDNRISNIEVYLEANDKDGNEQPIDDFIILQSQ